MSRLTNLAIVRKPAEHDSAWARYWHDHAPDAHDLAELFGISARRVRELWQEGWLTKGAHLSRAVSEYTTYRHDVLGSSGHEGGAPRRRG